MRILFPKKYLDDISWIYMGMRIRLGNVVGSFGGILCKEILEMKGFYKKISINFQMIDRRWYF